MSTINLYSSGATLEGVSPTITLNFTVELSEAAAVATTYYWSTLEGTAIQGVDYSAVNFSSLTFAAGERIKTISVTLFNDNLVEADESLFVNIFDTNIVQTAQLLATARGFITDLLKSDITTSLADPANVNVESLTLTGIANIDGTGNSNDNNITGNTGNNVLDGGSGNDSLAGSAGNDTLKGGYGNDILDGGTGADSLGGGAGDDLYIIDSALDVISSDTTIGEIFGGGTDTVQSSINFALKNGSFIENLTLAGSAINGSGNEYNNLITGNSAANLLNGAGNGIDVSGNDTLLGLGGNDTLKGGDGNDILDGGTGLNSLVGGTGNDIYVVTNTSDVLVELANEGIDRVETASSYSIANKLQIEDITLTGDKAVNATGNTGDNVLIGNDNNNLISGGDGNDRMDGKGGLDTLLGGNGDDVYRLNENPWTPLDIALESATSGTDTVQVNADYTLGPNFERLELLGNGDFSGYGNSQANVIFGNDGNNILDGKGGADILQGGLGDDTYILGDAVDQAREAEAQGGNDTVIVNFETILPFTLSDVDRQYIENVTLGGPASAADGNSLNNLMVGNEGADVLKGLDGNDTLIGGSGDDTLIGGDGNATYTYNNDTYEINIEDNDIIVETQVTNIIPSIIPPGFYDNTIYTLDTIIASYSGATPAAYTMAANVERFFFDQDTDLTLNGNASLNFIQTGSGNDTISGGDGNDTVNSASGLDSILGGLGDDSLNAGDDNDTLIGGEGNDTLNGGTGTDLLVGGNGNDVYVIDTELDLAVSPESLTGGVDRVESSVSYRLLANFENLTLTGTKNTNGMGTALNNVIIGNGGNNSLDGQAGDDSIDGSSGDDTLFGQAGNDTLLGGSGLDVLLGQTGNDRLNGGYEADTMRGGLGDDTYDVQNLTNLIIENVNEGTDLVNSSIAYYTLTDNVEKLVLVSSTSAIGGTGNALANTITGNSAANVIDGAAGNDTMIGGDGNDKYYVDSISDSVVEAALPINPSFTSGEDIVFASVSGYTLANNVENLTLIGTAISGTGNALNNRIFGNDSNNNLNGGGGNDYLDGGLGKDTMAGGLGDDVYFADVSTDVITEGVTAGTDRLISLVSQTLSTNVENLTLLGLDSLQGIGNVLNNVISGNEGNNVLMGAAGNDSLIGNSGSDQLSGGSGNDTLSGGSGADLFNYVSSTFFSASDFGSDLLTDFKTADFDKIRLGKTTFGLSSAIGASLSAAEFKSVANENQVATSSGIIVQSQATGNLYFNPNGAAAGGDILFATTNNFGGGALSLLASDFVVG